MSYSLTHTQQTGGPRRRLEKWTNYNITVGRTNCWVNGELSCRRRGKLFIVSCYWIATYFRYFMHTQQINIESILSIVFRNYCVRMPFQGVPSKMVARKCYHCAMKIVWPHISSSVTTIGFYWKRNVIVACHWRPEDIFDYPTANHCHDTITLLSIQHAPMLVLPKCIQKISHVS